MSAKSRANTSMAGEVDSEIKEASMPEPSWPTSAAQDCALCKMILRASVINGTVKKMPPSARTGQLELVVNASTEGLMLSPFYLINEERWSGLDLVLYTEKFFQPSQNGSGNVSDATRVVRRFQVASNRLCLPASSTLDHRTDHWRLVSSHQKAAMESMQLSAIAGVASALDNDQGNARIKDATHLHGKPSPNFP
ncbi:MAG: hypothetical protein M1830_005326 [Pleopsidium flavum]|nr:MAG: hypothetical protein M1830_005326 [Pleopsidium flavum]